MIRPIIAVFASIILCGISAPSHAAEISGAWNVDTRGGPTPLCSLVQAGNNLDGWCVGPQASGTVTGTVDGPTVRWRWHWVAYAGNAAAAFDFAGTLGSDNMIKGVVERRDRFSLHFTATRQSAAVQRTQVAQAGGAAPTTVDNLGPLQRGSDDKSGQFDNLMDYQASGVLNKLKAYAGMPLDSTAGSAASAGATPKPVQQGGYPSRNGPPQTFAQMVSGAPRLMAPYMGGVSGGDNGAGSDITQLPSNSTQQQNDAFNASGPRNAPSGAAENLLQDFSPSEVRMAQRRFPRAFYDRPVPEDTNAMLDFIQRVHAGNAAEETARIKANSPSGVASAALTLSASAETVDVKYRGFVDLGPFACTTIERSSFINRVCYDRRNEYMLISLNGTYYHYCEIDAGTVSSLLDAASMGRFYNASIKGNFDCRAHPSPRY